MVYLICPLSSCATPTYPGQTNPPMFFTAQSQVISHIRRDHGLRGPKNWIELLEMRKRQQEIWHERYAMLHRRLDEKARWRDRLWEEFARDAESGRPKQVRCEAEQRALILLGEAFDDEQEVGDGDGEGEDGVEADREDSTEGHEGAGLGGVRRVQDGIGLRMLRSAAEAVERRGSPPPAPRKKSKRSRRAKSSVRDGSPEDP